MSTLEITDNIGLVDTMMGGAKGFACVAVVHGERAALLDAGLSIGAERLLAEAASIGAGPGDIAYICPTHAHYDHAGGCHELLRLLRDAGNKEARIACSAKAAGYLQKQEVCEKLMVSGRATFGAKAGEMRAVPADDFHVIGDGSELDLGGASVRAIDSPGHANGHLVYEVAEGSFLFTGDACGLLGTEPGGGQRVAPTAFAPEYRHDAYLATVEKIAAMGHERVCFAHYGLLDDPAKALPRAMEAARRFRETAARMVAGDASRSDTLSAMDEDFGRSLHSLYGSSELKDFILGVLLDGMVHDIERE